MLIRVIILSVLLFVIYPVSALEVIQQQIKKQQGIYYLNLTVELDVNADQLFDALMDYDALQNYSDSILASKVLDTDDNQRKVFTHIRGCVALFCREIKKTEQVTALARRQIMTTLIPEQSVNVRHAISTWTLMPITQHTEDQDNQNVRLEYVFEFAPSFWSPSDRTQCGR